MDGEQTFTVRIAGVTYKNADGTSRQALLRECRAGEVVQLKREPDNPHDPFAVAVLRQRGEQLGYIPRGDALLAIHIDRGGEVRAQVEKIIGGPTLFDRLLFKRQKSYGCVLLITKGGFNWPRVSPWMDSNGEIDTLIKEAKRLERSSRVTAVSKYLEAIEKIIALDSQGTQAAAWRMAKYPINRLSLTLERLGETKRALEEIDRWKHYRDVLGIPDSERKAVEKRKSRLRTRV